MARTETVNSLSRGLAVIRSFSTRPEQTAAGVAAATSLTRASARRVLLTLLELGYVRQRGRLFSLAPRVLEIGYSYLASLNLPEVAQHHMERVVAVTRESCSIAVLDGTEIVYVARVPTDRIMTISLGVGSRLPAAATSMGRVLLAFSDEETVNAFFSSYEAVKLTGRTITDEAMLRRAIEEVRRRGWALVDQELEEGVRSIARPIFAADGSVMAAINVSGHAGRVRLETMKKSLLPVLSEAARAITADLHRGSVAPSQGIRGSRGEETGPPHVLP